MRRADLPPPLTVEQQAILDLLGRVEALELVVRRMVQSQADVVPGRAAAPTLRYVARPGGRRELAATVGRCSARAGEGQREAPQHRGDDPAGMAFGQQKPGGVAFLVGNRAVMDFNFSESDPGDGVPNRSHLSFSRGADGCARQGAVTSCRTKGWVDSCPTAAVCHRRTGFMRLDMDAVNGATA